MLSSQQLRQNQEFSNTALSKMEGAITALNKVISEAEADSSRSRDFVVATCKAAREKALPVLSAELKVVQAMAEASGAQQRFWESRPLVLSLQTFDSDQARDAQIRLGYSTELKAMPLPLLAMTLESARTDTNRPLIYQCWLAGWRRAFKRGWLCRYC